MALQDNVKVKWPSERNYARSVSFPKAPGFPLPLITATLTQKMENHDLLVLTFAGKVNDASIILAAGDPVVFSWSSGSESSVFVGYVHSVRPITSGDNKTEVFCVSPSYLLKNSVQKIYKNVTADVVVQKVCKKYGLKAVTQRHAKVWNSIVQTAETEWQLLRRLAMTTGFALVTEATSIYFMSKDKLKTASKKSAPYFYAENQANSNRGISNLGTIMKFNPFISDEAPDILGTTVKRVVTGMHQVNGTSIATVHSPQVGTNTNYGVVEPNSEYFEQ